ncbi:hypothetical protein ACFXQA_14920 [Microbacterium sp. P07]|uniref:hypothetical protein n=1 Tax=Microbacterium sp. P07 TaxID=3366952 RepID=UPI0037468CB8
MSHRVDGEFVHTASFLPRRALEAAAGAVIAVSAFLAVVLPLAVSDAVDTLAQTAIATARGADVTLTIGLPVTDDPGEQDRAVREALASTLGPNGAGLTLDVTRAEPDGEGLAQWVVQPRADAVTAAALDAVPAAWRQMRATLSEAGADPSDTELSGSLVPTALAVSGQAGALRSAAPIALAAAGVIAAIAANEIARLLAARGRRRTSLLWSRGARTRRLLSDATLPSAVAMLIGAVGGALGGLAVAGHLPLDVSRAAVLVVPALTAAVAIALVAAHAYSSVRALERPETTERVRSRRAVGITALLLLVAAALFSGWQLLRQGADPALETAGIAPVAFLAPAVALVAFVVGGVMLLAVVRRPAGRVVGARLGPFTALWTRGAFRRGAISVAPLLVCALALGQLIVAAGFAGSWTARYDAVAASRWGTALRLDAGGLGIDSDLLRAVGALPEVETVAPIRATEDFFAAQSASILALTAPAVAELAAGSPAQREEWAGVLAPSTLPGWTVEGGTTVELTLTGGGSSEAMTATVFLGDENGEVVEVDSTAADAAGTATVEVPADAAQWQLFAVQVAAPPPAIADGGQGGGTRLTVGLEAGGRVLSVAGWSAVTIGTRPVSLDLQGSGALEVVLPPGEAGARFFAGFDDGPLPVVVSAEFLEVSGLTLGDRFSLSLWSATDTTVEIAAVTPAVPGAARPAAVMIDAWGPLVGALAWSDELPAVTQAWIAPADGTADAADALGEVMPDAVRIDGTAVDTARGIVQAAPVAMWWGAWGTAVLALLGTGAVSLAARDSLASEARALRSIGMRARTRRAARVVERTAVVAAGLLLGGVGGCTVVLVLIPSLVRGAAVSENIGPALAVIDSTTLAASIAVFVSALSVVVALAASREPRPSRPGGVG